MDLGKHVCGIAPRYSKWSLNWVKDMVLPLIDNLVQPANLLPKRILTKVEILKLKFEVEKKVTNQKI